MPPACRPSDKILFEELQAAYGDLDDDYSYHLDLALLGTRWRHLLQFAEREDHFGRFSLGGDSGGTEE